MFLLDVNVLVALMDSGHIHHDVCQNWYSNHGVKGWATCPITENGFLRVLASPAIKTGPVPPAQAAMFLKQAVSQGNHTLIPDSLSILESLDLFKNIQGHRQITDLYLLTLCRANNLRLATLDRRLASLIPSNLDLVEFI